MKLKVEYNSSDSDKRKKNKFNKFHSDSNMTLFSASVDGMFLQSHINTKKTIARLLSSMM